MSVQYRIAKLDGDRTVDISQVQKEEENNPNYRSQHMFTCPCCGERMMARLGKVYQWHFAHIGNPCEPDYYLHSTAEDTFFEEYKRCLDEGTPFTVTVWSEIRCAEGCKLDRNHCYNRFRKQTINLTDNYKKISPEKRVSIDGRYRRPDLLLESESGKQLWVEIWVTNASGKDKRKDGEILELKIESEDDIKRICSHNLVQDNYLDFKLKHYINEECQNAVFAPKVEYKPIEKPVLFESGEPNPNKEQVISENDIRKPRHIRNYKEHIALDLVSLPSIPTRPCPPFPKIGKPEWIDLGLPSGTLWSKEYLGTMTLRQARERYPGLIPTPEQFEELVNSSQVIGLFPAGFVGPNGNMLEMYEGDFWTCHELGGSDSVVFHREFLSRFHGSSKSSIVGDCFAKSSNDSFLPVYLARKK